MSFIDLPGIGDVKEPKVVPENRYDLVISEIPTVKPSKDSNKRPNMLVVLQIEGEPDAANVLHNLALIGSNDEENTKHFKLLQIKRFCHWFGIDISGGSLNTEEFAGRRASGIPLAVDIYEGTKKNVLKLPPLPEEE